MRQAYRDLRCARLRVPQTELLEVEAGAILNCLDEVLAGRRFAVVAVEIEVGAFPELLCAGHGPHHADHLGPLVIDSRRIEVVDFLIGIGADRVRQRAGILGKLRCAQNADVLDPLDRLAAHIGAEELVAQDREALFQAELEPVSAGHAVARPVVEILVTDHAFHGIEIAVGRGFGVRQHIAGVEDVETLVLHRPHVEVGHGDHVEQVEVVLAPEGLLVPLHRGDERIHRVLGAILVAGTDPDVEIDLAARHRGEG